MVSDGVLDALPGDDKEQAMQQYLESVEEMVPRNCGPGTGFCGILYSGSKDDMTVLAAGSGKDAHNLKGQACKEGRLRVYYKK